jgi:hypothetical protein
MQKKPVKRGNVDPEVSVPVPRGCSTSRISEIVGRSGNVEKQRRGCIPVSSKKKFIVKN